MKIMAEILRLCWRYGGDEFNATLPFSLKYLGINQADEMGCIYGVLEDKNYK
jgi:hypothetical protein